jgi:hypothetical protein
MKHLKKYKLFESVNDDAYEKWAKVKADYDKGLKEIKDEYLKGVSECLYDLTDHYDFTSKVEIRDFSKSEEEYWKFIGNVIAKFKFEVPIEKFEEFFDTLIELNDLVKSHVSKHRRIIVKQFNIQLNGVISTLIHRLETYSLEDVKSKLMKELNTLKLAAYYRQPGIYATIQIEI